MQRMMLPIPEIEVVPAASFIASASTASKFDSCVFVFTPEFVKNKGTCCSALFGDVNSNNYVKHMNELMVKDKVGLLEAKVGSDFYCADLINHLN